MSIKSEITDPASGIKAIVDNDNGKEKNGLIVATRPLKTYNNIVPFFVNELYGADMNKNALASGTPDNIYKENAGSPTEWQTSAISGTWDFDYGVIVHAGSKSIDATRTTGNNTSQFQKSSNINLSDYSSISGWIYYTSPIPINPQNIDIYGWDTNTNTMVGNRVDINDYVNRLTRNVWQQFNIPLIDMALDGQTINAIRIQNTPPGTPENYILDDIAVEESGILEYTLKPNVGTWLHVDTISISMSDSFSAIQTVAGATENATLPSLSYDKLLGHSLTSGILYQRIQDDNINLVLPLYTLQHMLVYPNAEILSFGSDGTNAFLKIRNTITEPLILKSELNDRLSCIISENLSGFNFFQINAACREEIRYESD